MFTLLALQPGPRRRCASPSRRCTSDDERVRGTALEYLETVLPDEVRDAVWPFLGEERPMRPARGRRSEILADLRRSPEVVAITRNR